MNFLSFLFLTCIFILSIVSKYNRMSKRSGIFNQLGQSYDEIVRENTREEYYENFIKLRDTYEKRLEKWLRTNSVKNILVNNKCELMLYHTEKREDKPEDLCFYCKEHIINGKAAGRFFCVKGNNTHVTTMWAIINMEFSDVSMFDSIRELYWTLNNQEYTAGENKYFHEKHNILYPEYVVNKWAMNEFCRIEIQEYNGENYLVCKDIWNGNGFYIKADKMLLYVLLSEFVKEKNKMQTFSELFDKYKKRNDCIILTSLPDIKNQAIRIKQTEVPVKQAEQEKQEEIQDIKKYDERNLDL